MPLACLEWAPRPVSIIKCEGIDPCQAAGMIIYEDAPKVATVQCMIHLGTEVHGHVLCKQMASLPVML